MTQSELDITVEELKAKLDRKENIVILDVRNPPEREICRLEGSILIPLPELPQRLGELDPNAEIVVHCRSGGRSLKATQYLREQGFSNVRNLKGGILAWATQIDPTMPKY
ncbi:MAG: rhodanese-like domain-containing protein [Gemmataceae bacterium]|nr:rhodanese-like domain-containing protein [Gemmataceae bacterium]MDW8265280.1 rhodanese-like domain-containing protein [Gemmataceae bacterium]